MVSSKKGPFSGSGLSKMASTSSLPLRSRPSTATSSPGMKSSTRTDAAEPLCRQLATIAATRAKTDAKPATASTFTTPWLPERSSGLITHG